MWRIYFTYALHCVDNLLRHDVTLLKRPDSALTSSINEVIYQPENACQMEFHLSHYRP
ncbi:Hypothetical protein Bdt_1307 [Bdellovibrio bacteriovorus str. Tiberius]|uniref:Uncharacterized protein n=1 Tax=Bdellovibrio bacteriovorus str. Tiberius TaxID=1069642 RepID=K7YMK1_BDEBC|nr:Hypothetical protein Bdt_1307 [Bdellovibrio bacteriovorus str. Tiberius]